MSFDIPAMIANMTCADKAHFLAGSGFWHTPESQRFSVRALSITDGPHGIRKQPGNADHLGLHDSIPATCFPSESALACSFDPDLAWLMGQALGEECRNEDIAVLLGPGANIKRHPLCGRNFEYFSEDPLLSGTMAAAYIRGIQSTGVGASLKHFAANNQEKMRMVSDSIVDDRALHELYLKSFEIAVKEGAPWTVMGAYNRLNGTYCCENPWLLQHILRDEWGFEGATITDWGGMSSSVNSVRAGLDLAMPGPREDHSWKVMRAVQTGELPESALDRAVAQVLALNQKHDEASRIPFTCDIQRHLDLASRIVRESAVLLENNGVLPISASTSIAVIGAMAKRPRYQGSGSSKINPITLDNAWDALRARGIDAVYAPGYSAETGATTAALLDEAQAAALAADVAIVFAGLPDRYESEGYDRIDLRMPEGHNRLIERVSASNPRTIVVLAGGAPVEMPWRNNVAAIMVTYLCGCQGGAAIADLLLGLANPSGKLAETWPNMLEDTALGESFPHSTRLIPYIESTFVGYRYYGSVGVPVAYPFGFGRSYTTFRYSDLRIESADDHIELDFELTNTGAFDGAEVVQVYAHAHDPALPLPAQTLVAFSKIHLAAQQSQRVHIRLNEQAFSYWDNLETNGWRIDEGTWELRVGSSSEGIRLRGNIALSCDAAPFKVSKKLVVSDEYRDLLRPYYHPTPHGFTLEAFKALYRRAFPKPPARRPFNGDSPLADLSDSTLGRLVIRIANKQSDRSIDKNDENMRAMVKATMHDMPLRSVSMTGLISENAYNGIIDLLNGRHLRGLARLIRR